MVEMFVVHEIHIMSMFIVCSYTCIKESIFVSFIGRPVQIPASTRVDGICNMWHVTCLFSLQLL